MPRRPGVSAVILALVFVVAGCVVEPDEDAVDDDTTNAKAYGPDCTIANWLEACAALASPNESPSKTEIDLAVNPKDPGNVFVASKDLDPLASACVWSVGQVTVDGGSNWSTVYVGGTLEDRADPAHPLYGWDCVTDPIMAWDDAGVLYYALQAYNLDEENPLTTTGPLYSDGSAFYLAVSRDGGRTFPAEDIIALAYGDGSVVYHDYPRMTINPATGAVLTVWNGLNVVPGGFVQPWVVATRDGGKSADRPTLVTIPDAPHGTRFASGFTATRDGTIYMTVARTADREHPLLAVSHDDGRSFDTFLPMFEIDRIGSPPNASYRAGTGLELAADNSGGPRDGRLWAVWPDDRAGNADILASWSDDEGASWTDPVVVAGHPHDEFMSRVSVDARGNPHIVFLDRSHDVDNVGLDVSHAVSLDGGSTWDRTRLTNATFDGDLGLHQDGFPFMGDYLGIGAHGDDVWMGFPSTRTGKAEVVVAHVAWSLA